MRKAVQMHEVTGMTVDRPEFAKSMTAQPDVAPARLDSCRLAAPDGESHGTTLAFRARESFCHVDMPGGVGHVAEWGGVRARLMTMGRSAACEWEFMLPSLVIMASLDGDTSGCEWSDGGHMRRLARLPPHAVVLNPPDHYLCVRRRMPAGARLLLLIINPEDLEGAADDMAPAQVRFRQQVDLNDPFLHRLLQTIAEEMEMPGPGGRLYRHTLTLLLVTQLMRCASNLATPAKPTFAKGGLPSWRLKRALDMLEGRVAQGASLAELAQHVGLHPTSFCRAFKQSTGVSPHRYLLERRVARAKEMMADHAVTLTQIALDCGFCSSSQFSVIFRRLTGISPSMYRRSL
jgi:AraC-like DNA-binding protein